MTDERDLHDLEGQSVELLQALIRNACVNDGTPESGQEVRNADTIASFLEGTPFTLERFEPTPGRTSLVARLEGSDPAAPRLCLMGHTDVVPVNPAGWSRDPFGGELVDGEVWGRGAVDMLNLTATMAVAVRHLARKGLRPKGGLVFLAVADEESGSEHGARWLADHARDAILTDYVLTESGGLHGGSSEAPTISVSVAEKGVAWRRLRIHGTPGHGSAPFKADNALARAAAVITRLTDYRPAPRLHELWQHELAAMPLDDETRDALRDPANVDAVLDAMPFVGMARRLHACTHTTFSCNVLEGKMKTNIIPDLVELGVDIRTMPGDGPAEVQAHLEAALGDLAPLVEVETVMSDQASMSRLDTPLWDALQRAASRPFPDARLEPKLSVGFTDSRVYRELGAVSYGAGLLSPTVSPADFGARFHGNDERIDVESLGLSTRLWIDVVEDLLG